MIQAGSNFSHIVAYRKAQGHLLVMDGVYRLVVAIMTIAVFSTFRMKMVQTSVLRWILLLGARYTIGSSKPREFPWLLRRSHEVLFLSDTL